MQKLPYIEQLVIHPVKGLRGVSVDHVQITPFGLAGDRRYMLVDDRGRFMSQRRHPELTHFELELISPISGEVDPKQADRKADRKADSVRIHHAGSGSIVLPLDPEPADMARVEVSIWDDTVQAEARFPESDSFFSEVLGERVRLVWMHEQAARFVDPAYARPGERVNFADGFPLLVLGSASIQELNTRLGQPLPINRFRANVIVGGAAPWQEDEWTRIVAGEVHLSLVRPCARCVVITTDQETGERSREPTATLATYRVREGKVMVGMNALAHPVGARLSVGEALRVK